MDSPAPRDLVAEAARAMLRRGEYQAAITLLTGTKSLSPPAADVLCDAYFQAREWQRALDLVRAMLAHLPPTHYRRVLEAKILNNMGQRAEALAAVESVMRSDGEDAETLGIAKICCHFLGQGDRALAYGQKALSLKDAAAGPSPTGSPWTARGGTARVIAYAVWGGRAAYLLGAALNVQLAKQHFPGWTVRIYTSSSVDVALQATWQRLGAQVVLADAAFPDVPPYFWRFLVADDADTGLYLCRDADSRLGADEATLVAQWLASGKPFHVVRDHVLHDDLMLAGLWGGTPGDGLRMREAIAAYFNGTPSGKYGRDQVFLGARIWPRVRPHVFVHDAHYATEGVESHRHGLSTNFGAGYQNDARVVDEARRAGIIG